MGFQWGMHCNAKRDKTISFAIPSNSPFVVPRPVYRLTSQMTSNMVPLSTDNPTSFPMTRQAQVVGRFPPDMILTQVLVEVFWGCCDTRNVGNIRVQRRTYRAERDRKRLKH